MVSCKLPATLFPPKDTKEYLNYLHRKVGWVDLAVSRNIFNTSHFAWIDHDVVDMLPKLEIEECQRYLHELHLQTFPLVLHRPPEEHAASRPCAEDMQIFMPGCSEKQDFVSGVLWRFCGSFFMGRAKAIQRFHKLCEEEYPRFINTYQTLVWEVNYWAWLEANSEWDPVWYKANHDSSLFRVPMFCYARILATPTSRIDKLEFPIIDSFRASNCSYLEIPPLRILNTRFVNYEYLPSGHCIIHDSDHKVKSTNYVSVCDSSLIRMSEDSMGIPQNDSKFQGLEDVRLYELEGQIYFLATTVGYSKNGMNSMVRGRYDLELGFCDCKLVESAEREKNWIPFIVHKEYFIYSWTPVFQIGEIVNDKLNILIETPFVFWNGLKLRGSSNFVWTGEGYVGLIHGSIGTLPNQYYHCLVWLHKETFLPSFVSELFCFFRLGIEFCLSMSIIGKEYCFWVSCEDRNPVRLHVPISSFQSFLTRSR